MGEVATESLMLTIGGAVRATVIVDEGHPAHATSEARPSPKFGSARILDNDVTAVFSSNADEYGTGCEKLRETRLFCRIFGTRVVGDRVKCTGNGKPENSNDAGPDPAMQ